MIPTLTLCSVDGLRGMVDVYNHIIKVVNILTFIYLFIYNSLPSLKTVHNAVLTCQHAYQQNTEAELS